MALVLLQLSPQHYRGFDVITTEFTGPCAEVTRQIEWEKDGNTK